ncbi:DUF6142 family protein [Mordavella massiliensis]|uniref:Uncharacterized protein n=1 Tax=Mordavella massiliensis TaxID=1871024 RepID=A0A938XCF5_9CLOT|nr:DUF6142 family protein [Mordavella massiliensis]MBM6948921.1 hypothetical protein [Mordavella massiliensis]
MLRRLREAIEEMAQRHKKKKAEKEKMKRRSRKYGQAQLKHSRRGMRSTFLGVCCLFLLVLAFSASYISRGDVGLLIGFVGLFALALAVAGLKNAVQGFKEREKNYLTCKVGAALNGVLLAGLAAIFLRGLF